MWFIYSLISTFFMACVDYTDEHLATSNKAKEDADIHSKAGSVLLISTLMCFVGAGLILFFTRDVYLPTMPLSLAILSSVPMVMMYISYFYLLQKYPTNQVIPLFQLSAIWLLLFQFLSGGSITVSSIFGVLVLIVGAYILDTGTFKWKIPTKLLLVAIPVTSFWATALFLAKIATAEASAESFTFWQLLSIGVLGVGLFLFVKKYREAFIYRIKHQGRKFLGLSMVNETFAQGSAIFNNIAVSMAPVTAFVAAMSGLEGIFLIMLLFLFPQGERTKITKMQVVAAVLIAAGLFLIEKN